MTFLLGLYLGASSTAVLALLIGFRAFLKRHADLERVRSESYDAGWLQGIRDEEMAHR
jgi:hypothetical protein